jgi:hypothetical protein
MSVCPKNVFIDLQANLWHTPNPLTFDLLWTHLPLTYSEINFDTFWTHLPLTYSELTYLWHTLSPLTFDLPLTNSEPSCLWHTYLWHILNPLTFDILWNHLWHILNPLTFGTLWTHLPLTYSEPCSEVITSLHTAELLIELNTVLASLITL